MNRRRFLVSAAATTAGARDFLAEARELHRSIPVFLGGCNYSSEQFQPEGGRQSDLSKFDAAGVRTIVTAVGSGSYFATGPRAFTLAGPDEWILETQLRNVADALAVIRACPKARLITTATQTAAPPRHQTLGVILEISGNNHTLDLGVVDRFADLGVRLWHPALPYHNRWCSAKEGMAGPVLTEFGRRVIARMNQRGIVLDTAHATDESAREFIRASMAPVVDSHTTSTALVPQSRGHDDGTLRMIADKGGVIGVHFAEQFLTTEVWRRKYTQHGPDGNLKREYRSRLWEYNRHVLALTRDPAERMRLRRNAAAQEAFYRERGLPPDPQTPRAPMAHVTDLANTIDYLIRVAGQDHVGLGGDVNGIGEDQWPADMRNIGELPHLTAELLRRGYSGDMLRKLYYENWRRVYTQTLPRGGANASVVPPHGTAAARPGGNAMLARG